MKRRFIIGIEGLSREQEDKFRDYLEERGSWWHWIGNLWLFCTESADSSISAKAIREKIVEINEGIDTLVMEVSEEKDWSARSSANSKGRRIYNWLEDTWDKE